MVKAEEGRYKFIKDLKEAREIFRSILYWGEKGYAKKTQYDASKGYYITTDIVSLYIKNDYEIYWFNPDTDDEYLCFGATLRLADCQWKKYGKEYIDSRKEFLDRRMREISEKEEKEFGKENYKKFKFSTDQKDEYIFYNSDKNERILLRRIVALEDIKDENGNTIVHKGEKGGYVRKPANLSQEGTCWIYDDSMVYDNAQVSGDAQVSGRSYICEDAQIFGQATVSYSKVRMSAEIYDNAKVEKIEISGHAKVCGNAQVERSTITTNAKISGNAIVKGCHVCEHVEIVKGVFETQTISDETEIEQ